MTAPKKSGGAWTQTAGCDGRQGWSVLLKPLIRRHFHCYQLHGPSRACRRQCRCHSPQQRCRSKSVENGLADPRRGCYHSRRCQGGPRWGWGTAVCRPPRSHHHRSPHRCLAAASTLLAQQLLPLRARLASGHRHHHHCSILRCGARGLTAGFQGQRLQQLRAAPSSRPNPARQRRQPAHSRSHLHVLDHCIAHLPAYLLCGGCFRGHRRCLGLTSRACLNVSLLA